MKAITDNDLVLPGDCLGGAMRNGSLDYSTEALLRRMCTVHPDDLAPNLRRLRSEWLAHCKRDVHDCRRPEVRDRLRRVLAAGERCSECDGFGRQHVREASGEWAEDDCETCNGTGDTRPPHDLGWLTDAELSGRIAPTVAAALWWCSVLRVEAGMGPVVGLRRPWADLLPQNAATEDADVAYRPRLRGRSGQVVAHAKTIAGKGWVVEGFDAVAEIGADARAAADAAALSAGFALLNADHFLLPPPDGPVRLDFDT